MLIRPGAWGAFLVALLCAASAAGAQTVTLQRVGGGASKTLDQAADFTLCLDDVTGFVIEVHFGPPNSVVAFDVAHSVAGVIGISLSETGPFSQSVMLPVALDGNGNGVSAPIFVQGETVGETVLTGCSAQLGCVFNPQTLAVGNVASLLLEAIDNPLDNNPNAGGGQRIFPDKQTADDDVDRRQVRVRATLSSPSPDMPIFFRTFDVDDPSSDAIPVDPNGANGNDNRGTPQAGTLSAASAQTDDSGAAQVELTVTMQPGDNFRIAAACNSASLGGVVVNGTDLSDGGGNTLPTQRANVTDMLTVWRRVHIEMDSMGLVSGNRVTGTITRARLNATARTAQLSVRQRLERSRFQGGVMMIDGLGGFPVTDNTRGTISVFSGGVPPGTALAGRAYVLVDDDDFNSDDPSNALDGDDGENVTAPDTSLVQDSDDPGQNVFAPAYVRPIYDIGDNNDLVPFVLNVAKDAPTAIIATYDFDSVGTEADDDFWTIYLLGAYQFIRREDMDPVTEPVATLGIVDAINGRGASVYNEVGREAATVVSGINAVTTAHEIGHLFNGQHTDGGLMTPTSTVFTDVTLDRIRSLSHP
ncbi:MAG TPA: hypothetical protein VF756_22620 [Thermoanaerobaculia bacterium]